jgi:hypothetical protein
MSKNDQALARALFILREVTKKLAQGVKKSDFERQFHGKYVSPGVSVRRHVEELRISGSLEETDTSMQLRSKNEVVAA